MIRINALLQHDEIRGPFKTMREVDIALEKTFKVINSIIPSSALVVSGSVAFYYHYGKHLKSFKINNIDIALIHSKDITKSLLEAAKCIDNPNIHHENKAIVISFGDIKLRLDIRKRIYNNFNFGISTANLGIRIQSKNALRFIYKSSNELKNASKLKLMLLYSK